MTNRATKIVDTIEDHFSITALVTLVLCFIVVVGTAGPAPDEVCTTGTYQQGGACVALPIPASADTMAEQDAASEGQDVLMLNGSATPPDLWNALADDPAVVREWYSDEGTGGNGTFYIPTGIVVDVPGGLYLATVDGWMQCRDDWQEQECSTTGPVYPTHIPWHSADHGDACAVAAGLTLDAFNSWTWIEEDLSYRGMSEVEAACNDELATAYYGQGDHSDFNKIGRGDALRTFLEQRSVPQMSA